MTNKTVEELADKRFPLPTYKGVSNYGFIDVAWGQQQGFIAGYNEALKPKWVELPELPKKEGWYLATCEGSDDKPYVRAIFFNGIEFIYGSGLIAWMPFPQPFTKDTK